MPNNSNHDDNLYAMRHSLAHIMAAAVTTIWPQAKLGVGPVIENGFYYDIDIGDATISEADFSKIEKKMRYIIAQNQEFIQIHRPIDDAINWAKEAGQSYKSELLNDLKRAGTTVAKDLNADEFGTISEGDSEVETVSFYENGNFVDLCRGPHVASTGKVGAFKLMRVAGAYWRGKEGNPQMQRLYGVAFETQEELDHYLHMLEEAKARDHRKLGRELDLFFFHETALGMAYWLPNGVVLYNKLVDFWREEHRNRSYSEIVSPVMNKKELYQTSGHFDHYWEDMFTSTTSDGEEYGIKAMNCPNAMVVFGHKQRSYRELPLRLSDTDPLHRHELSGTLNGLLRIRSFRQDDAHVFVTEEQISAEYKNIFEITERFYSIFGLEYSFRLGTRPEKFMGDPKLWDSAESTLKQILEESGKEFFVEEGDGAFYGPKIDILMKDSLGRPWQMGTIQLDFQQPIRFDLKYTDEDGKEKTPIAIHRVIYGSLERFIGILIEHVAGWFPFWLAPEQVRILTINDTVGDYVDQIKEVLDNTVLMKPVKYNEVRYTVDIRNESLGKKIREAVSMKIPVIMIVGPKDVEAGEVSIRTRDKEQKIKLLELKDYLLNIQT
ncbi:threonine--tRNA ligase [Candidatus Saccharibacteria bacterium]|nr:threonine--tRNA ligase [Candidatus Saccharibacteria bacterium]